MGKRSLKEIYNQFIQESIEELVSLGGEKVDDPQEITDRLNICKSCPLYIDGQVLPWYWTKVCDKTKGGCGCDMSIKAKMRKHRNPITLKIELTTCPLDKWPIT